MGWGGWGESARGGRRAPAALALDAVVCGGTEAMATERRRSAARLARGAGVGDAWDKARAALPGGCSESRSASCGRASGPPRDVRCSRETAAIVMRSDDTTATALFEQGCGQVHRWARNSSLQWVLTASKCHPVVPGHFASDNFEMIHCARCHRSPAAAATPYPFHYRMVSCLSVSIPSWHTTNQVRRLYVSPQWGSDPFLSPWC